MTAAPKGNARVAADNRKARFNYAIGEVFEAGIALTGTEVKSLRFGEGSIVETAPGWAHDVTNIGDDELIVMLWANELFDRDRPDTIAMKVDG